MAKWSEEDIIRVAKEMYEDGSTDAERYSQRAWESRGWPEVDDNKLYDAISRYLKFMRSLDEYNEKERPRYISNHAVIRRNRKVSS